MRRNDIRQLKGLRRFPVPPEFLADGRLKLIAAIEAAPMMHRPSAWFLSTAWRPVMAALVVIVAATGAGTVVAAHGALPGDRLYGVKLATEGIRERMTITSEQRFVVSAAHASRRLEETENLLDLQGLGEEDRAVRVREAMDRYEGHLFVMNEITVKLEGDPERPSKGKQALKAAEAMFDRHVRLIESATSAELPVASSMLDPIEASLSLEADMLSAIPVDDGETIDGAERHQRERAERIGDSLKRLRADLEGRRKRDDESRHADDQKSDDAEGRNR